MPMSVTQMNYHTYQMMDHSSKLIPVSRWKVEVLKLSRDIGCKLVEKELEDFMNAVVENDGEMC